MFFARSLALAPRSPGLPIWATVLRLHLTYAWRHRRLLSLGSPTTFNELVQWRKRHDRDARLPHLIDKLAVKRFVADRLGPEWVTPTSVGRHRTADCAGVGLSVRGEVAPRLPTGPVRA